MEDFEIEKMMKLATTASNQDISIKNKRDDYYRNTLSKSLAENKGKLNKASFLLGTIHPSAWFFYRKMYVEGIIIFLICILFGFCTEELFKIDSTITKSAGVGLNLLLALTANEIYKRALQRKINKGYHMCPNLKNTDMISLILTLSIPFLWLAGMIQENFILPTIIASSFLLVWVLFSMLSDKKKVENALKNM